MSFGPHTTLEQISQKLLLRWVPKWYEVFTDPAQTFFYERLTSGFKPVPLGYRRLLTQCRQLAVYSHASRQTDDNLGFAPDLRAHFEAIRERFYNPVTGGWFFSVDEDGKPKDRTYDLYTTSFVIFALCHYYRATGDEEAHHLAVETLSFIDRTFRMEDKPGFAEALGEDLSALQATRRQNPHMHLLEACLFAAETWPEDKFRTIADEIVSLFLMYFYDAGTVTLREWFDDDLKPDPQKGHIVEPGHFYEWIWLLRKHAQLKKDPYFYDKICFGMLEWANAHGWDNEFGGIYDEVHESGALISDTKRIWPFTEALKANALLLLKDRPDNNKQRKQRIADMVRIFRTRYIEERGFWTERLNRDLTPATDYMPGTTPYHVYFGIMETRDILRARGKGKSLVPVIYGFYYRWRRQGSNRIKAWKSSR